MKVSVLLDGDRNERDAKRVLALAAPGKELIRESEVVVMSDVPGLVVAQPDTEDLFHPEDYLRLYNWAHGTKYAWADLPQNDERILRKIETLDGAREDHAPPAYALTDHKDEFFASARPETLDRFDELMKLLNGTIPAGE